MGGIVLHMTFEERVEEEVNKRMAKRLLKDESYESGSFYIEEVESNNQWIRQPMMVNRITAKMRPITGDKIVTGHYMFIRLGS